MVMDFTALPQDVQEFILCKLPLIDLAHASATCRLFQAVFREQLAREQAFRCEFAAECYGRERISAMVRLIVRWLEGESLDACRGDGLRTSVCWISQDGKCHQLGLDGPGPDRHLPWVRFTELELGHVEGVDGPITVLHARAQGANVRLVFNRLHKNASGLVHPHSDHDLEGVALVHALQSEGLAKIFNKATQGWRLKIDGTSRTHTAQGLKALITPLMPFVRVHGWPSVILHG